MIKGLSVSTWLFLKERAALRHAVDAREEADRLRLEAENRQKLTQATVYVSRDRFEDADELIAGIPSALQPLAELASASLELGDQPLEISLAAWRAFSLALMDYRRGDSKSRKAILGGDDAATFVAFDRGAQGQTFQTGTGAPGYELTAVWLKHPDKREAGSEHFRPAVSCTEGPN